MSKPKCSFQWTKEWEFGLERHEVTHRCRYREGHQGNHKCPHDGVTSEERR